MDIGNIVTVYDKKEWITSYYKTEKLDPFSVGDTISKMPEGFKQVKNPFKNRSIAEDRKAQRTRNLLLFPILMFVNWHWSAQLILIVLIVLYYDEVMHIISFLY